MDTRIRITTYMSGTISMGNQTIILLLGKNKHTLMVTRNIYSEYIQAIHAAVK